MLPKHVTRNHFKRLSPEIKQYEPVSIEEYFQKVCDNLLTAWRSMDGEK